MEKEWWVDLGYYGSRWSRGMQGTATGEGWQRVQSWGALGGGGIWVKWYPDVKIIVLCLLAGSWTYGRYVFLPYVRLIKLSFPSILIFRFHLQLLTRELNIDLGKKLVRCYVWSIALHGSETWTLRKLERKYSHLENFEMWCWRRMEKIKWPDKVTNE